jgi:spore coat polysaccharide biosynthesis protein SpsF
MGSTRLPGKVLRVLGNATVLAHVVRRAQRASSIDEVVIATTELPQDDAIAEAGVALGASVFRGSEDDVLSRYYLAAKRAGADVIVRITSDCPLLDADVLQAMVIRFLAMHRSGTRIDYLSNTLTRTYPRGLDVEVFTFAALERANREAGAAADREHVTPYVYRNSGIFRIEQHTNAVDASRYRWTLDTEDDWRLLERIFARLGGQRDDFTTREVFELLVQEPGLAAINFHVVQKEAGRPS